MLVHDFIDPSNCWCSPETIYNDPQDGGHGGNVTMHHDEAGNEFAYTIEDDYIPCCPDCDGVIEALIPDPPHLIQSGHNFWSWNRSDKLALGISFSKASESVFITMSLWNRFLHVHFTWSPRRRSVDERLADMAPELLDEIEQHLRSHG